MLTKCQRDLATGRKEARTFRAIMDKEVGDFLDKKSRRKDNYPRVLKLCAALNIEYRKFLRGATITRATFMAHFKSGHTSPALKAAVEKLAEARGIELN